ncbi:helix-turn-helix transcriptional regulator [Chryseobacterium populi]|uniref:DNA-binding domain-containing protein, AraC-type n=1 Tax=Chryseobacterium populi TaxID=1144316 RepID=J2K0K4_9FLAO|nr:AraC family transcriptional regulator [Chryseobacterium populi]EJL73670.1 DNA-binding domain-containing protein, AraC-type [Chryseobacterium populi]
MKNQYNKGALFSSEDITITMQGDLASRKLSRAGIIESRSSFNLLFLLSPNIHLEAQDCSTKLQFKKNQYILHYSSEETQAELWTENQEILKYLQIRLDYHFITHLIHPESNPESAEILENMITNNFIFLHKETPPYMTVEMHMILKEILSYSKKGVLQKLFIEAKIIKLLILIFEQFSEKNTIENTPKNPTIIKKYIDENYHKPITVEKIAKVIGINQNTIRKEFKAQYHTTISSYISDLRMLKAKKLIIKKDILIKEIAIECGYDYVQNFTRAFKKKFGVSPEKLRIE